jgi:excisionase family DNA binding protein
MEPLMGIDEVCEVLGVKRTTLWRWRRNGEGPRWLIVGDCSVRYDPQDVRDYIEELKEKGSDGLEEDGE